MMVETGRMLIPMMTAYFNDNEEKFRQYGISAAELSLKLAADFMYTILYISKNTNTVIEGKSNISRPSKVSQNKIDFLIKELNKPVSDYVMVAAHRGDHRVVPENSLQGIKGAIEMGADIVEIDLQKTKDGKLILMHDETLDRTTTGKGKVEDYLWEDIKKLRLKNTNGEITQYKIPTFEEIMLFIKTKKI